MTGSGSRVCEKEPIATVAPAAASRFDAFGADGFGFFGAEKQHHIGVSTSVRRRRPYAPLAASFGSVATIVDFCSTSMTDVGDTLSIELERHLVMAMRGIMAEFCVAAVLRVGVATTVRLSRSALGCSQSSRIGAALWSSRSSPSRCSPSSRTFSSCADSAAAVSVPCCLS